MLVSPKSLNARADTSIQLPSHGGFSVRWKLNAGAGK